MINAPAVGGFFVEAVRNYMKGATSFQEVKDSWPEGVNQGIGALSSAGLRKVKQPRPKAGHVGLRVEDNVAGIPL